MNRVGLVVLLVVQFYISGALWRLSARRLRGGALYAARAAAVLFGLAAVAAYLFSFSDLIARMDLAGPVPTVVGAMGLLYAMAATASVAASLFVRAAKRLFNPKMDPGRRRVLNLAGGALVASPFLAVGYGGLIQRTNFRVREIDLPIAGLADDLDGFRIVHLSDIHLSPFLSESEFAQAIDASAELKPHLAVVTGDLISTRGDPLDACLRQIARLRPDAGIFGCMGNHERYSRAEAYAERAGSRLGVHFLRSASRQLRIGGATLNVAGVDYQSLAGRQEYLKGTERMLVPGACNLLLSHNPDVFPVAVAQGWHAMLSGHTHGGQVTVEILDQSLNPARFITPYIYGLFQSGNTAAYVTRGIGTIGIPARLGAPPEISVIRLRKV